MRSKGTEEPFSTLGLRNSSHLECFQRLRHSADMSGYQFGEKEAAVSLPSATARKTPGGVSPRG